jgi:hypothetical protein
VLVGIYSGWAASVDSMDAAGSELESKLYGCSGGEEAGLVGVTGVAGIGVGESE